LQAQELEGIKERVLTNTAGGVRNGSLTEQGFLYLLTSFIQQGRQETTWAVLRKFGYGEDMKLTEEYLYPK
jgi:mitochondrial Rho GTPase 1